VGLHTAVHAALSGVSEVTIIDINEKVVELINNGKPEDLHVKEQYVIDNWSLVKSKIRATTKYSEADGAKYFIVAVQTPRRGQSLDFTPLKKVAESLAPFLESESLVVSEVTIYPGGTYELLALPLSKLTGYNLDDELMVAHVPERLNAGSKKWVPKNIPRVVGGIGPKSLKTALSLYRDCFGIPVHPVEDIRIAEASKLLENSFRFINISFINELKRFFDRIGIDIKKVISAASTKPFGFMPFYPGPYIGGACLPKDALMLEIKADSLLLRVARLINESQPLYYAALLLKRIKMMKARKVLFYGLGFKPNSPYPYESPVLKVITELKSLDLSLDVKKYDPQIPWVSDFSSLNDAIEWADVIVRWGYKSDRINKPIIDLEDL
jgi:UDP-N-acetyl-D-glucosamine dehydrogenase